ncbi:HypC/HybG/HupF family hydrogenase formation chaperone [Sporosarcina pasteurii]|uniref:Hydrogenase isoenzymes formation protein hypC n=1 Tax=Sporosarcina pasteurii TaxID=1474 RepID=A0A380BMR7_SPOPA|nr:HypC/HybG/HupF family hydrogenase formation chaperone [Sporosarcina pasteurii]MDS9470956.1 HypC/HybG/HupF family hydrogenase formation chaperone [Sporosarcina pasteurii]QBQ05390.1 HypC/HybG/HupF family hydrogenase formation chaperone [Sporosarcina pasteurii]SUJ03450.1 Hydrogenase isoenzymes formation protein hypC [Sporosarcina pasteurii]
MCIAVPARVIEIEEQSALVDVMGSRMHIGIFFVPEVNVDDYVLLHAGQAMTIVDENFAKESIEEWRNIIDAENGTIY